MIRARRQVKTGFVTQMQNRQNLSLGEQLAAVQDWWRDAGVDQLFEDEVQVWLAEKAEEQVAPLQPAIAKRAKSKPKEEAPEPLYKAADLPQDLASFQQWWTDPANDLPHGKRARIAPRGKAGARLMFLVQMPESADTEQLLSGQQGRLLTNIARALGIAEEELYFASALPCHCALPDFEGLAAQGFGAVVKHHITLVRPERLAIFSSKLPILLGQDPANPNDRLSERAGVKSLATFAPERLLDHPRQRARLWQRLLDWTA